MKNTKLIEAYGRKFTPLARIAILITIAIAGILIAFDKASESQTSNKIPTEQSVIHDQPIEIIWLQA